MADESSVRVAVRIRPLISREKIDMCRVCTSVTPGEPQVWLGSDKAFTYDLMFDMDSEQQDIYSQCTEQLIEGCLEGYNATVLAYGQTGSGKTYTMGTGFEVDTCPEAAGIIPRAVDHLFRGVRQRQEAARQAGQPPADFKVSAQFMELYNEEIIDLLDQSGTNRGSKSSIRIHEDADGGIYTLGVTSRVVTSAEDCLKCLRVGALSRTTASTQMNVQSSRSHAIFTLVIKQMRVARADSGFAGETESGDGVSSEGGEQPMEFETLSAKFHFVDLAGSERLKRTGATGDRAKEGISINCGLLALGNVISALGDESRKVSHIPYRDSKLTRLLQDSLGGNSRTVMIACVSPSDADFMETLNTLKYANRARNIKNRVTVNQDKTSRTISLLRQEIQQLQLELMEYRQGKRVVTEDGTEAINDMYHENNMLQSENANLRTRIKAIQETIQGLTARNAQLLAEQAAGDWIGEDAGSDMTQVVAKYLQEIEELRARLMESENTCQMLRKQAANRNLSRLTLSPRPAGADVVALSPGAVRAMVRRFEELTPDRLDQTFTVPTGQASLAAICLSLSSPAGGASPGCNLSAENSSPAAICLSPSSPAGGASPGCDLSAENSSPAAICLSPCSPAGGVSPACDLSSENSSPAAICLSPPSPAGGASPGCDLSAENSSPTADSGPSAPPLLCCGGVELSLVETGSVHELIEEARRDLERDRTKKHLRRSSSEGGRSGDQDGQSSDSGDDKDSDNADSEREDSTDERESEDKDNEDYNEQLAELTSEISVKQRLIDELERSQRRMDTMRQQYEQKLQQLSGRIKATEQERDKVISGIAGKRSATSSDDVRKVKDEYERKLSDMAKEMKKLRSAQREHAKLVRSQGEYARQVKTLKTEVVEMKKAKVKLMQRMKEDANKMKQMDLQHHRAMSQLKKEHRKHESQIKSLEAEKRLKDAVLKRKQEEIVALRKQGKPAPRTRARLRPRGGETKTYSPAVAKKNWQSLEKSINQLALNKQTVASMEREMERQLKDRENLRRRLARVLKQRDKMRLAGWSPPQMVELEETIEGIRANMDYINDNINECQASIMAMEESKEDLPIQEPALLVRNVEPEQMEYLLEKLIAMTIHQSCVAAQHEATARETEVKMEQMEQNSCVQQQLLQHLMTEEGGLDPAVLSLMAEASGPGSDESAASDQCLWRPAVSLWRVAVSGVRGSCRLDPRPSPLPARRTYKEALSPRLARRNVNITNNNVRTSDSLSDATPPGSPASYRRQTSREENVFKRLTSTTAGQQEERPDAGVITPYQGRAGRAPLICTHVAEGHAKAVLSVCATNDMLLSGSKDRTVKVWDLRTGHQLQSLAGHPNNVVCVRYSEVAQLAFSVSSAFVKVWDLREGPAKCVKTLSSSGLTSSAVPLSTPSRTLQMPAGEAQINDVCLSGGGRALYTASLSTVRLWDLRKFHSVGKLSGGHQAAIMCLAVDRRRGRDLVLTGSKDHYIKGFEVPDDTNGIVQQCMSLEPPHYDGIQCLVVSGDTLFSGSRDACIKQWDLQRQTLLQSVSSAHRDWICGLSLAPGGQTLLSGCRNGVIKLWGVEACQSLGELRAHGSQINAITANQSHVFTASNDHTIGLWRLRNNLDVDSEPS
ncbi:LOW QUALITY PROTEIN: kinesin-like protein KIF21A [Pollicipes pollicipes]|uniref:LOW QUALITY PROTEIN: kinesin-like protein KIF21A n=1 Tax=Pollicipes pollicipes TaxID=41117 RepID=UPI001884D56F|nr:LOW QUALITY PROTEIN: kinesin-like protein KIF21A [Pollicipes pollicipes]